MATVTQWSKAENEQLRALWDSGMSTAKIGALLGKSKNAVIGRARRLDLDPRFAASGKPEPSIAPPRPSPFAGMTDRHCRFPIGDPGTVDFRFCRDPAIEGKPYCAVHTARAYVPGSVPGRVGKGI